MDQINLGHENLIPVYMYPKIDEYFVNIETKSTDMICLNPKKTIVFLTRLFCGRNETSVYLIIPGTKKLSKLHKTIPKEILII